MRRGAELSESFGGRDYPSYDEVFVSKKRPCCPNGGGKTRSHLDEKLKAFNDKDQKKLDASEDLVKKVLADITGVTIGEQEARDAFKKLEAENKKMRKIAKDETGRKFNVTDVNGVKSALKKMQKTDKNLANDINKFQKTLSEKITSSLRKGKTSLHESVSINGVKLKDVGVMKLRQIYKQLVESKRTLSKRIRMSLNEGLRVNDLKEKLAKKNLLLEYVDQELTYRVIRQKCILGINESVSLDEDGVISEDDLQSLFGPAQTSDGDAEQNDGEASEDGETSEDGEEQDEEEAEDVALSRIIITMKDKASAEKLGELCVESGMSEDDYEIEKAEEDEEETEDEEAEGEGASEEGESEENAEETEPSGDNGETHESVYVKKFRKMLFEGFDMEDDEAPAEGEGESDDAEEGDDASEETTEDSEEGIYKFILTNIDKVNILLDVLEQNYGKSREEVEKMIGAELVDDNTKDESDEESSDEDAEGEDVDDNDTEGENVEMNPADLFGDM